MTDTDKLTDIAPGRVGLGKAVKDVKDANAQDNGQDAATGAGTPPPPRTKETRGRKSKAEKEAAQDAGWEDLAKVAVNLIKQPIDAYAVDIDPYLADVGYPKGTTFAMKPEEEQGTVTALKIVISKLDPDRMAKWAPWIVCGGIMLQLTIPRYMMVSKIRQYIKEKEEKESGAVDTTAKKTDDNAK